MTPPSPLPPNMPKANFVFDIWYFAAISPHVKTGKLIRRVIAGQAITLGRKQDGSIFALRDVCPHRAAPMSSGKIKTVDGEQSVECPYHGWRFGTEDGACKEIPSLCADQDFAVDKVKLRTFPVRETGNLVWVYIASDKRFDGAPDVDPPDIAMASLPARMYDSITLNCNIDHAAIGLMDPAHGPYVHKQWWWRTGKSMYEKTKAFEPRANGFAMVAHSPSSNSLAYKLLGGKPVTEITFLLPGVRTEEIKVGKRTLVSLTIVTPIHENQTEITQVFFTDIWLLKVLTPVLRIAARKFLRQDASMVDLQQMGLRYDPTLLLVDDADAQAKWYHALKKEWAASREQSRAFKNPVKAKALRWRS